MDIIFFGFLVALMSIFSVLAWLPRFGFLNQMIFTVLGMGIAFLLVLAVFGVTTTTTELYTNTTLIENMPTNDTTLNYPDNQTLTHNATWLSLTTTYEDVYTLSYVFLMMGLVLALRLVLLMLSVFKGTALDGKVQ